jgi:cardiolipin synthase
MIDWKTIVGLAFVYGLTLLLIRWVLLTRRRHPISSTAWILTIVLLPYLGGVLFLFFGINRVQRRKRRRRAILAAMGPHRPQLQDCTVAIDECPDLNETQRRIARLVARVEGSPLTRGNEITLLNDTNVALRRIEEAIIAAERSVHLEYYIWQPDKTGMRIRDLLIERARSGVKVRFLYDGLGSMRLTRKFLRLLVEGGATVSPFVPGRNFRERWSINLRSHRKIVVVDGQVGFTGGMNIGDEYLGRNKYLGYWRDTHLRVLGPSVLQLQQVFLEDWYYATGEEISAGECFGPIVHRGGTMAHVISSGPDGDKREYHALMFSAINEARSQILMSTSYFVPTEPLLMALCTAASRGVRVRLLLPSKSDHRFVVMAGRSYYEELLDAGVEIHEYRRGVLHSKTLTIDGVFSLVGTANFDPRSLLLNFEVGVPMYDRAIAAELEEHFEKDFEHARLIRPDEWNRRPVRSIFAENVCRLFSPVL